MDDLGMLFGPTVVFAIRNKANGKFLLAKGAGSPRLYLKEGYARNAIHNRYETQHYPVVKSEDWEVVELKMTLEEVK